MACRQIIKYGRAKHAWMGLYLSMDQWTERLSRSLEKQGMGKINGVLVPWRKSAVPNVLRCYTLNQSEPDSHTTVGHSVWIELLSCFPFSEFFWGHISLHLSCLVIQFINLLILDVACSMFFSMAAQLRQKWSTSIFQVLNVEPDSPADIAGLRPTLQSHQGIIIGDEILSVDGKDSLTDKL